MVAKPTALNSEVHTPESGKLVVYSGWDRLDTLDPEHHKHTPYLILSGSTDVRQISAQVRNQSGSFGEDPEVVELPTGQYWVEARATNVGRVRVPVSIVRGQTAVLYLDSTTSPAGQAVQESQWIR
jgi:hypothetical protein